MRHRAFTLIEMLVVATIIPFVLIAVSGVYATFIRDIPHATRVLQENTTVLDLLEQMGRDMDEAVGLPEPPAGDRTLLIAQPGRTIRYEIEEGRVTRFVATPPGVSSTVAANTSSKAESEERVWRIPDAVIAWRRWIRNDRAYAVEIHSYVKQRIAGTLQEKLPNSHVFFIPSGEGESE